MKDHALIACRLTTLETGNPFEDQFGDGGILADHNKNRWDFDPGALPAFEFAFVMAI
jgi:hypothetical protein